MRTKAERRWLRCCPGGRTPRGESFVSYVDSRPRMSRTSQALRDVEWEDGMSSDSTLQLEMDATESGKFFTEAFRALSSETEERLSRGRKDTDMTVLLEGESDEHMSETSTADTEVFDGTASQCEPLTQDEMGHLWRQLQQRELPSARVARALIEQTREHLRTECSALVHVPRPTGRLIVIGDLHGHASDFWHVYTKYGPPSSKNLYLFNGDWVDRGIWGPEVVFAVFALRLMYPKYVFLNRGNHESEICTKFYGFQAHMACAYPDNHKQLYDLIHTAFNQLPLAHLIDRRVFVAHAGLPDFCPTLGEIEQLQRGPVPHPAKTQSDKLFVALLWSDPRQQKGESDRGIGWHFSEKMTRKFVEWNSLDYMVRSHECVESGFQETHAGYVKTVFSASNYDESNNANAGIIDSDLKLTSGDAWNEVYINPEWLEDAESAASEFDMEALESSGGGFAEISFEVTKNEGDRFGFLLNMNDASLEVPIIAELHPGLILDHNIRSPEQAVRLGDAILDVNGACGKNITDALMASSSLHFRLRRPKTVHVQLTAAELSELPPLDTVRFPDYGFGYCFDQWGPVTQVDRIVEVNGKRLGEEMKQIMMQGQALDMTLLRYAPEEFIPERYEEKMASRLRERVVSEWGEAGAQKLAVDAVRMRLGAVAMDGDLQQRVLSQVYTMIYLDRASLLEKFQLVDKKSARANLDPASAARGWRGAVTREQWSTVLRTTLETGTDFPWLGLRPFLCAAPQESDSIEYVPFLLRYQNPLSSWLLNQWCGVAVDQIAFKIQGKVAETFERLDDEGLGKLDFETMRDFIIGHLFSQASNKVEQEHQEVLVFALFNNKTRTASVSRGDFRRALSGRNTATGKVCPLGHALQEKTRRYFLPEAYTCDECGQQIMDETWSCCERDDFDLCNACSAAKEAKDEAAFEQAVKAGNDFELQWARVRQLLETLSSSLLTVADLFSSPPGSWEIIGRERFVEAVGDIFREETHAAEELFNSLYLYLKEQGKVEDGKFSLEDLVESLKVQDTLADNNLQASFASVAF